MIKSGGKCNYFGNILVVNKLHVVVIVPVKFSVFKGTLNTELFRTYQSWNTVNIKKSAVHYWKRNVIPFSFYLYFKIMQETKSKLKNRNHTILDQKILCLFIKIENIYSTWNVLSVHHNPFRGRSFNYRYNYKIKEKHSFTI